MKKTATILKTMLMAAIIFVMAQGCVPTGGPTPTNEFHVDISSSLGTLALFNDLHSSESKTLFIDGDSIRFSTAVGSGGVGTISFFHYFDICPISNNVYEFIADSSNRVAVIQPNISIDANHIDNTKRWTNINSTDNKIRLIGSSFYTSFNVLASLIPYNTDRYIVFRKLKQSGYQYYWVKMRYTNHLNSSLAYTLTITKGRYQMNSITTGQ